MSALPCAVLILSGPAVGRIVYPADCACAIDCCVSVSELRWQTIFVASFESAEASVRGVGTWPPAHGDTEQSGAGSGQYEARSMCADASAGASAASNDATVNEIHSL